MKDQRVDTFISASEPFAKPILTKLRKLVHQACPDIEEKIKWGVPHFDYKGPMANMAAFKQHCAFGFWKASLMEDFEKKMSPNRGIAWGHFGRITSLSDLPSDAVLLKYIREACRLNDEGIKIVKAKAAQPKELTVPPALKKALSKNKKAQATFDAFSYANKKDYAEWVADAKTEETRNKRIETAIAWMAEGKIRNWKYAK
ncbi:MAG: YdeI/OmpD-associated family protein [Cytophagales bacterium]|nr:YdeI/OmpD-associated family protein [Cytophagales bacterium]